MAPPKNGTQDPDDHAHKPSMRGVWHQHACVAAIAAGGVLIASSPTPIGKIGAAIYSASLVTLLGVSAAYHRLTWGKKGRAIMRQLDHSAIFVLIAGTYTPMCMLGLPQSEGRRLLLTVWGGAALGIAKNLLWAHSPKALSTVIYIMLGWCMVPYAGQLHFALGRSGSLLLLAGGISYTVGGIIYARKWPNPYPKVFGYHEIFHALTILASVFHFSSVFLLNHSVK